jgi:serine/threonine protein phosphatase PrpC
MAWAVFDGHAGWKSAEFLKNQRLPFMQYSLMKVKSGSIGKPVPEELFRQAIIQGFVNLDDSIIKQPWIPLRATNHCGRSEETDSGLCWFMRFAIHV